MSAASPGRSPSPADFLKSDLRPEKIRFEVGCNPRSQLPEVQSAGVFVFEVGDECSSVLDETGVFSDPNLQDSTLAELVAAPEDEADAIAVAK